MMNEMDLRKKMLEELMGNMDDRMASRIPQDMGGTGAQMRPTPSNPPPRARVIGGQMGQMGEGDGDMETMEGEELMQRLMRAKSMR